MISGGSELVSGAEKGYNCGIKLNTKTIKKSATSSKRVSTSKSTKKAIKKQRFWQRAVRTYIWAGLVLFLTFGLVASFAVPESSRFSYENMLGKNKGAPYLDTLSGNYSVAGEAASTSLLVKYKSNVSESERANVNAQMGAKTKRRIGPLGVDVVQVDSTATVGEIMSKYKSRSELEYVEPNHLAKRFLAPDDSLFSKQWYLQKIEAQKAWDVSQGGFGPIAIVDTGVAGSQADLSGHVQPGYNFVGDNTDTSDDNGHGTHVAGIVSAATNNATGIASIGFKGSILPIKVLDHTGAGTYGDVASGIVYAADRGAKIINISLGGSSSSATLLEAVRYALGRGVVVVAAAGNNSNDSAVYPAAYPGVIAVTATAQDDSLASFSSYGNHVYISAPGVSIISTYNNGGYATLSGTSMAAPAVSGLIGLALSRGSTTAQTVLNDLKATSDKVGGYAYDQNGWNRYYGYGRINAARLLAAPTNELVPVVQTAEAAPPPAGEQPKNKPATAGKQFDVSIGGFVDSIDAARSVIVVKVKSSSSSLQLHSNNLVDLYVDPSTIIKSGADSIGLTSLKPGDSLNIKSLWKDNQLIARDIVVQGGNAAGGSLQDRSGQPNPSSERSRKP